MKKLFKYIARALLIVLLIVSVSAFVYKFYVDNIYYVNYDNIDEIVYAEPTEKAKSFDIEKYVNSLPELEYKHIDYPVKETYEYKFNGHKLTIDIPEGYTARELPLSEKPKIRNTKNAEDSCLPIQHWSVCFNNTPYEFAYKYTT